jgi:signal transduction histidine kinase
VGAWYDIKMFGIDIFNTKETLLFVIAALNGMLAFLIGKNHRKDQVNIWFSIIAVSLAVWAAALIFFRILSDYFLALIFLKLAYIAAIGIAGSFYVFAHYFPDRKPMRYVFFAVITASLIGYVALPGVLVIGVIDTPTGRAAIQEITGYGAFFLYFMFYFFGALVILYHRWRFAAGIMRKNIGYIIWSILTAGIFGIFFNLVLPSPFFAAWGYVWLGPLFTAIMVVAVFYAVMSYQLLNIKVISAEMLATGISFILFLELISAREFSEIVLRALFFLVAAFFSVFLVRSVEREVAEREELQILTNKLAVANDALRKLDQAKSEFISLASHQLRTPLTVIRGYLSMALENSFGSLRKELRASLELVMSSAIELIGLVDNLLNLSRIESGKIQYAFEPIIMAEVVKKALRELTEEAKAKGVALFFKKSQTGQCPVLGDSYRIHEAVMNLLDNAVKYSRGGAVVLQLNENLAGDGKRYCRLSIRDRGIGIAAEDMPKLFTKFGRSEDAKKIQAGGLGIGLYFVKRVVEDHHGRVWAESPGRGRGSIFFMELPCGATQKRKG